MTPKPLENLRWGWHDHKSALWWLGLIYRRPTKFENVLASLSRAQILKSGAVLFLHSLIYIVFFSLLGRFLFFEFSTKKSLMMYLETFDIQFVQIVSGVFMGLIFGIAVGFAYGIVVGRATLGITSGIAFGITLEMAFGIGYEIGHDIVYAVIVGSALGIAFGISCEFGYGIIAGIISGITFGITVDMPLGIFVMIALGIAVIITNWIAYGLSYERGTLVPYRMKGVLWRMGYVISYSIIIVIAIVITYSITGRIVDKSGIPVAIGIIVITSVLRVYYYPLYWWLVWPNPIGRLYPFHPVAWDDLCRVPFHGLAGLLVAYAEYAPRDAEKEIERLINHYPSQRLLALCAKTILLSHRAGTVTELSQLENIVTQLPEGEKGYLTQTSALRNMVYDICQLQIRVSAITRPILREPYAQALCDRIENFRHQIAGFHEPLASEFRKAATQWLKIAHEQLKQLQTVVSKVPSPQVFRAGDPVNREQEAFVARYSVVGDLEKQIMLATGCPGLVLYGRRRMGKSTILGNLSGFLPITVVPVTISMQDPQAFTSLANWVNHLVQKLTAALAPPTSVPSAATDLPGLMRLLTAYNTHLQETSMRLLLAVDEYENLDLKLGEKIFPQELLATIRESVQMHRQLTWIFAGSHDITELMHAEWPSYLVSARTVEVPLFTPVETQLLLTEPLKYSSLWPKDSPKRPRFVPEFWGEKGIEAIHDEAGGWPHLVQLLAETIVDLINDETKHQVDAELFERSLNKAVVSGHNVLYQLMRGESTLPGEWDYLSSFRKSETQPPPQNEALYVSLRRRLLVEEENNQWRLRVPLMARWLRQRG